MTTLKARQKLGKYRLVRRIASGPYADVFEASDTIEGVRVALKVPHATMVTPSMLEDFRREVRITARLDHPNVQTIKNADFIGERFVVAQSLGTESLADRLKRRLGLERAYDYAGQLLEAVAHAHEHRIIHCDIKPENVLLFPGDQLRLTDFGISKVALRTLSASGSGTVGYVAPEQALGQPRFESDVFSAAIVVYRMISGARPEWPFQWPLAGSARLRRNAPRGVVEFLRKCLEVDYRKRHRDGISMFEAWEELAPGIERYLRLRRARRRRAGAAREATT
ncbi:MAG: serine/threonine-protein kinase [Planctomycetota bacterium JB042]